MFHLMTAVEIVGVKIVFFHLKALEMRMRKLVLDLSLAQILPAKINKMFLPKKLGFIDVLRTVYRDRIMKIELRKYANIEWFIHVFQLFCFRPLSV